MKSLILALSLLFLTGTHGRSFLQSDEPKPATDDVIEAISEAVDKAVQLGSEAVKTLESSDFAKHINVNEKREALKAKFAHFHHQLEEYGATVREQVDKELQEKYPVFKEKALPIIKESLERLREYGWGVKKDFRTFTSEFFTSLRKDAIQFFNNLRPLGEGLRDKFRSEAEIVRTGLTPYEAELREEYEKNKKKSD
uniref:Uncharacterized protein n=1 Tax=Leptobrachium leishanense TaxID=445787 RepID=A0A8C5R8Y5_9ANUR